MKYFKTVIEEVNAVQFTGNNEQAVRDLLGKDTYVCIHQIDERENSAVLEFRTEFSHGKAHIGEWIVVEANKLVKVLPQEIFELGYQKDTTPWETDCGRYKVVPLSEFMKDGKLREHEVRTAKAVVKFMRELEAIGSPDNVIADIMETVNLSLLENTNYSIMFPDTEPGYFISEFDKFGDETGRIAYLET